MLLLMGSLQELANTCKRNINKNLLRNGSSMVRVLLWAVSPGFIYHGQKPRPVIPVFC